MNQLTVMLVDGVMLGILGVTASLAIENAIKDACDKGLEVFIVGATEKIEQRLERFGILNLIPRNHLVRNRVDALHQAVALVNAQPAIARNTAQGDIGDIGYQPA